MLNSCPKPYSCGTRFHYYTTDPLPTAVGVPTDIKAYTVEESTRCRQRERTVQVMKCSREDFIYKFIGFHQSSCDSGFCGMT